MDTDRINWDLALGKVAPRPTLEQRQRQLRAESEALGAAYPDATLWDYTEDGQWIPSTTGDPADGQWVPSATAEATGLTEYRNQRLGKEVNYNG